MQWQMAPMTPLLLTGLAALGVGLGLGALVGFQYGRRRYRRKADRWRRAFTALESANAGLQSALESLEQAVGTDRLTGAWNRRRFEEAAAAEISLARRRKQPVSILMLDLDHFKRINDSLGHDAGDAVLVGVARAWKEVLRASDPLVRWGGEEFLVLSPASRVEGALAIGAKLREALRALRFPGLGPVTVSVGVAEYGLGESLEAWTQRADQALYRAKAEGRDRVVAATPAAGEVAETRPMIELQWEDAYASGHPLIDAQHRRLFELANSLLAALTQDLPREETRLRWNRLKAHTAQHFNDEERILARAGFPLLAHHSEEHQQLLARNQGFEEAFARGSLDLGGFVAFLVVDLVRGHLLQEDRSYFGVLEEDPDADLD